MKSLQNKIIALPRPTKLLTDGIFTILKALPLELSTYIVQNYDLKTTQALYQESKNQLLLPQTQEGRRQLNYIKLQAEKCIQSIMADRKKVENLLRNINPNEAENLTIKAKNDRLLTEAYTTIPSSKINGGDIKAFLLESKLNVAPLIELLFCRDKERYGINKPFSEIVQDSDTPFLQVLFDEKSERFLTLERNLTPAEDVIHEENPDPSGRANELFQLGMSLPVTHLTLTDGYDWDAEYGPMFQVTEVSLDKKPKFRSLNLCMEFNSHTQITETLSKTEVTEDLTLEAREGHLQEVTKEDVKSWNIAKGCAVTIHRTLGEYEETLDIFETLFQKVGSNGSLDVSRVTIDIAELKDSHTAKGKIDTLTLIIDKVPTPERLNTLNNFFERSTVSSIITCTVYCKFDANSLTQLEFFPKKVEYYISNLYRPLNKRPAETTLPDIKETKKRKPNTKEKTNDYFSELGLGVLATELIDGIGSENLHDQQTQQPSTKKRSAEHPITLEKRKKQQRKLEEASTSDPEGSGDE